MAEQNTTSTPDWDFETWAMENGIQKKSITKFTEEDCTDKALLLNMTPADIDQLGFSVGQRRVVLNALENLRKKEGKQPDANQSTGGQKEGGLPDSQALQTGGLAECRGGTVSLKEHGLEVVKLKTNQSKMLKEMIPSCYAISVLGHLMLVTQKEDVSLNDMPPTGGFKYIKFPNSLRASLVQVANGGHSAFMAAHVNMDRITILSQKIPDFLNEVFNAIETKECVEMVAKKVLNKVSKRATKCTELAKDTVKEFQEVLNTIHELLQATTSAESYKKTKLDESEKEKIDLKSQRQFLKEVEEERIKKKNEIQEAVESARKAHRKAIQDIPSSEKLMAFAVVQDLVGTIPACVSYENFAYMTKGAGEAIKQGGNTVKNAVSGKTPETSGSENVTKDKKSDVSGPQDVAMYHVLRDCDRLMQDLTKCFISNDDEISIKPPEGGFVKYETELNEHCTELGSNSKDAIAQKLLNVLRSTSGLCRRIAEVKAKEGNEGKASEIKHLKHELNIYNGDAKSVMDIWEQTCKESNKPHPGNEQRLQRQWGASAIEAMIDNAQFKVEQEQKLLVMYEEQSRAAENDFQETRRELQNTIRSLAKIDLSIHDLKSVRQTLRDGVKALNKVSKLWADLVKGFQQIVTFVEFKFLTEVNETLEDEDFREKVLLKFVRDSAETTLVIQMLSSMYVTVSDKFLMPPLTRLPDLIYPKPGEDVHELSKMLEKQCEDSVAAIGKMGEARKKEYSDILRQRLTKIAALEQP